MYISDTFSIFVQKTIKHLIVIEGPTASGKTGLSIALAKHYDTCILSSDSRQCYKELSIGTAKPTKNELEQVPHYFIDSYSVTEEFTSAQFETEALKVLEREFKAKDVIILTGGSGMFTDALCLGLDEIPSSPEHRLQIRKEYETSGLEPLLKELEINDPLYFTTVDKQNPMRIMRAIEVIRITGKTYSELRMATAKKRPFSIHRFVIDHPRENLYERINLRVDQMIEQGLPEEVKSVTQFRNLSALNTVGYKELFEFIDGSCSLEEAVESIKRNTRRYAKRQLTWFRRHPEAVWIPFTSTAAMTTEIVRIFESQIAANEQTTILE